MSPAKRKALDEHLAKLRRSSKDLPEVEVHQPDPGLRRGYRDVRVLGLEHKPKLRRAR